MVAAKTESLRARFTAADPGLLRLTAALRAVLGLALTLAALTALGEPSAVVLVGGFLTVVTSLASSDPHPRNQFRTLLAGAPVALAALTAGGLLSPYPLASRLAFLPLIFAAVYVRRYGRRGLDLGIYAFMAYFLSQFAAVQPHQLPQLTAALAVSFTAAAVARFGLVPVTSYGILTRLGAALDVRLADAQWVTENLRDVSTYDTRRLRRRLHRRLRALHTSVGLIREFRDDAPTVCLRHRAAAELKRAARAVPPTPCPPTGRSAYRSAYRSVYRYVHRTAYRYVHRSAHRYVHRSALPTRYTTRQAWQVTSAAALAMLGGHLISPPLWYWAVATAWVVFVNAEHTGDILRQSGRRLIGTVAGVPFGYGLAVLTAGHTSLTLAALLACVFGMFYTPSGRSYWAVTFFITGSLCMVLALLDTLSPLVLSLRVQETALGAGCGILAALLVLHERVPDRIRRQHPAQP
ncbi:FUSC family protein [Streptomyces sp. NPDC057877]|uniref:FUSC family protein n=1 Tax=Streptomyces sp. NPDC057877 TaxID=3346269 RepID=UPI0036C3B5D3